MKIQFKCFLLLIFIVNSNHILAEEKISYHFRKGFLDLGNGPHEYQFVDVPENAGYLTGFPLDEIKQVIGDDLWGKLDVEYWVFTSVADAELAMVELLEGSNLFRKNVIASPLPGGQIGDNCWYQTMVGVFEFIRNNVFVSVVPDFNYSFLDTAVYELAARQIDSVIIRSEKVYNPKMIPAPEIHSVDITSALPVKWGDGVKIKVNADDQKGGKLYYRKYAEGFAIGSTNGIMSIALFKNADSTNDPRKGKAKIWVWNEDHIVSSIEKEIPFLNTSLVNEDPAKEGNPKIFLLLQNYPNPFNFSTVIGYVLPSESTVMLRIIDLTGREITEIPVGGQKAGSHQLKWNGLDCRGNPVPSGIYVYRLEAGSFIQTKRMTVVR